MRLIFNHLLLRMLDLAAERMSLLTRQKDNIRSWTETRAEEKSKYTKRAEVAIDDLLKNKDAIQKVLEALESSKPNPLTGEQEVLIVLLRKIFKRGLLEYKQLVEHAVNVDFDKHIIEGLKHDQRLLPPAQPQSKREQASEGEE